MQTISIHFSQRPKNFSVKVASDTEKKHGAGQASNSTLSDKLTATTDSNPATSSPQPEIRDLLSKIEQHIRGIANQQQRVELELQQLSIQLAMQIATAVVQYEVTDHDQRIVQLLEKFQAEQESATSVVVRVNPADLERLRNSLAGNSELDSTLQLKADDSLARGDCRMESSEKTVVANYRRQLEEIEMQLMESLHDARPERNEIEASDRMR